MPRDRDQAADLYRMCGQRAAPPDLPDWVLPGLIEDELIEWCPGPGRWSATLSGLVLLARMEPTARGRAYATALADVDARAATVDAPVDGEIVP